jgi:hypothetical protein
MQSILKGLVVVIFVFSVMTFGFALMVGYSSHYDVSKKLSEVRSKVSQASAMLTEKTEARGGNTRDADNGIEFWKREAGKAKNANDRDEQTKYPALMEGLTTQFAQDNTKLQKVVEENIKGAEKSLNEKQKSLKELRIKVQQARIERDKAREEIEGLEAQKKELLNRTAQTSILLVDLQKRNQEVGAQLDAAKKAPAPSP